MPVRLRTCHESEDTFTVTGRNRNVIMGPGPARGIGSSMPLSDSESLSLALALPVYMYGPEAAGEDQSDAAEGTGNSVQEKPETDTTSMLNSDASGTSAAIEQYRKIPCTDASENSDPLLFWK